MQLIDTHCHLTHGRLAAGLPNVLDRARDAGLVAMICAAGNVKESQAALKLAHSQGDVWSLAGVHPHEAKDAGDDYLPRIEELLGDPRTVALGEIGLDYHYDFSPREIQRRVLAEQLELAGRLGKPVVIHTREAFDDTLAIIRQGPVPGPKIVFHSFTGEPSCARKALDLGAWISFSGIVTFGGSSLVRESALLVPASRILIETDAPYLSPEPVRKIKTNEPAHVAHVGRFLAALRGADSDAFASQCAANAVAFFGLPPVVLQS